MTARIFKPAKNAMQSGKAQTQEWQLAYEPEQPRAIEPDVKETSRLSHWPPDRWVQWRMETLTPWKMKPWKFKNW